MVVYRDGFVVGNVGIFYLISRSSARVVGLIATFVNYTGATLCLSTFTPKTRCAESRNRSLQHNRKQITISCDAAVILAVQPKHMNETSRRLFKKGSKDWNAWRRHNPRADVDLSNENLSAVDIRGADLRRIDFSDSNLTDANLSRANLKGVRLEKANLRRAKLNHANIEQAILIGADLREAELNGAQLERANMANANLERASVQRANLHGANLTETRAHLSDFTGAIITEADLSEADLTDARLQFSDISRSTLFVANLNQADLSGAKLIEANLEDAVLANARLRNTVFRDSILNGVNLSGADLTGADLSRTDLRSANLTHATLLKTNLMGAKLMDANLSYSQLVESSLRDADISRCAIYGISAWGLDLEGTVQANLVITRPGQSMISVDNLEIAQFLYLLLNNKKIRDAIDNIASKLVLVLGRFTEHRKRVLELIREELRRLNYLPVIFDFDKPASRDITETVSTLAHIAKFVIADITEAKSIRQELERIVPDLPSVPVQPLLEASEKEYGMFEHFTKYPWVLGVYRYKDADTLIANLTEKVIKPVEMKLAELQHR
jgi:uncharacterized protein YjbI with pentapeptide repeats